MTFTLAPEAIATGYRLAAHETIGSTNADAMERLRGGESGPLWVVSAHQSQGRGRRGSAWSTEPGNLAASLALTTKAEPGTLATLGFVAGVALVAALERVAGSAAGMAGALPRALFPSGRGQAGQGFTLKWPNDVLADGAKLAGILLEMESIGQGRAIVIGLGVNVAHGPEGLPYPAASLRGLGFDVSAVDLFGALSAEWVRVFRLWDEGRGFAAIRDLWLAHASGLGGAVSVRSGQHEVSGRFETIDQHGLLVIRTAEGVLRTISAGEVYFGSAATARRETVA
jgi:BirA family biotin operon repressor/biotin-[acetyl-CoA-carboxylase] ligase